MNTTTHASAPALGAHTAGPWHYSPAVGCVFAGNSNDVPQICTLPAWRPANTANGALLASAPDLLAALVAVAEDSRLVCNLNTGEKHYPITPEQMGEIRRAIARAKGQP